MPDEPERRGLPLSANGPAYTTRQERRGVHLAYVGEKLDSAIEELHSYGKRHPRAQDELMPVMAAQRPMRILRGTTCQEMCSKFFRVMSDGRSYDCVSFRSEISVKTGSSDL